MKTQNYELSLRSMVWKLIGSRTHMPLILDYCGFRTLLKILSYLQDSQVINTSVLSFQILMIFPYELSIC